MEIVVHGHNTDLSGVDRGEVESRVAHVGRVFEQAVEKIDVELSEEANPRRDEDRFRVELTAAVAGRVVRIEAGAASAESALDDAVDRLTRRVRRLKGRLIDRNRRSEEPVLVDDGGPAPADDEAPVSDEIVRVKQFVMKPMTVEEASLQMEMLGHSFFFFHNAATDQHSVLYRRRDGRLGLIEPA